MQHGSCGSFGKLQCLEMLATHETAWRTLSWTDNTPVNMVVGWQEPVSVSGNVIGFPQQSDAPRKELLLLRAPSKLRNVMMKTWKLQLPYDTQDCCIDSAQDLLISRCGYVTCIHICRISILTAATL
jgi:hypothetical protein